MKVSQCVFTKKRNSKNVFKLVRAKKQPQKKSLIISYKKTRIIEW